LQPGSSWSGESDDLLACAPPSPAPTVELGAAWQLRNAAQVSNEAPKTRFKIDALTDDGPFPAGRVVLDSELYA
jgi:hypothetical protein